MDASWLIQLLGPGNTGLASTIVLYCFVIVAGVALGKIKICGVSLGVTFVLFMGILMGHFGYIVNGEVLKFIREFGLILFIFSIGLQVGPSFFSSFKQGGIRLNMLALLGIALNVAIVLVIYFIEGGSTGIDALVGVMSGAVTNTPGLAAAQQTADTPEAINIMSMGYAAAYPLGVVGIITVMLVLKAIFRIKTDQEIKALDEANDPQANAPRLATYQITNSLLEGKTIHELHDIANCDIIVSRVKPEDGPAYVPNAKSVLHKGEHIFAVLSAPDEERMKSLIGPEVHYDWDSATPAQVVSRRILITQNKYDGETLRNLRLTDGYQLNATRVNRAGIDLLATPDLRLQVGDRLTVVGDLNDIERLAHRLGNSMKRLNQPNIITIFVGIMFGIILGSIDLGYGMKLGLAGGPLVVAILLSRFGYKFHLVTYTSTSASLMLRELGICLFLASVGISAGSGFAETVFNPTGMWWVIWGFIITTIPLLVVGLIARGVFKINYLTILGLFSGGYTDPPALAYANGSTGHDEPSVAYSTVYPLTMFMRVVAAQALILCLS